MPRLSQLGKTVNVAAERPKRATVTKQAYRRVAMGVSDTGILHKAMKAILPSAVFIGFTGTALLKADKQKSIEVFGRYIHIYKFDEAVRDGVVLDLRYEARDIDQNITSQARIDQWFEAKTRGLTDLAGKCAIVTSYTPSPADIKGEETGEGLTEKLRQYGIYQTMLADWFNEAPEKAVIDKLGWIKRQQARFGTQARQSEREMVSGESRCFLGARYRLRVIQQPGPANVVLPNGTRMELHVPAGATAAQRERVLHRWYRQQHKGLIPPLMAKWQALLGVQAAAWGIKKMKTKWGGCNIEARRIWLNLELAKKPVKCLEYVLVHELAHLVERHHNDRFRAIMNKHLPSWRMHRQEQNAASLGHETWGY